MQPLAPVRTPPQHDWIGIAVAGLPGLAAVIALIFTALSVQATNSQLKLAEQGQITDRYNAAITNLGSASIEVRLGGIYALQRLMQDSPRDQPTVISVLCAFVRDRAPAPVTPYGSRTTFPPPPSPDVQAALTVVTTRNTANDGHTTVVDLNHAQLAFAQLYHAPFHGANLFGANLIAANLRGAQLGGAHLEGDNLSSADLRGATLTNVDLFGANLSSALLGGAHFDHADLRGANLTDADLTGAQLADADLGSTKLNYARLEHANLIRADLTGAKLIRADLTGAILTHANLTGANLTGADLTGAKGIRASPPPP